MGDIDTGRIDGGGDRSDRYAPAGDRFDGVAVDQQLVDQARTLRQRAESLRSQAPALPKVLATAYRRRASELEFEAWVSELQSGLPYDQVHPAA